MFQNMVKHTTVSNCRYFGVSSWTATSRTSFLSKLFKYKWADTPDVALSAWLLFKLKPHVSFSLSPGCLPFR